MENRLSSGNVIKGVHASERVYSEQTVLTRWTGLSEVVMRLNIKKAIPLAANDTAYNRDRRTQLLLLKTEDANRADQRRINYSLIDSTVSKWRFPLTP